MNMSETSRVQHPVRPVRDALHVSRLTVEIALWIVIALLALILRVSSLGVAPLAAHEAQEAMLAWRAVHGQGMPQGSYSPLLFAANGSLFAIFGASDAIARLWPALFGVVFALTPFLLRERLGRIAALVAGLYLTISPTALLASRRVDGAVVAAAGVMLALGGLMRFFDTDQRRWLVPVGVGLALALTSSPSAYGFLVPLALAYLITFYVLRFTLDVSHLGPHISHVILTFLIAALALSTALGWNPSGLGAVGGLAVDWFARFGPASTPAPSPITLLVAYEPFALVFGVIGIAWAVSSRWGRSSSAIRHSPFALWAGLAFLLLILMPGREPLDLLWLVLPLAMLVGGAVEGLAKHLGSRPRTHARRSYGPIGIVYALVVLVLWGYSYLLLARYAVRGEAAHLTLALMVLIMQLILMLSFSWTIDVVEALQSFAAGTGIALLALTFSAGWGVAHVRPSDPREALARQPTAAGVRDLAQTLRDLSWQETGLPTMLSFTYKCTPSAEPTSDAVLAWYLRDFDAARCVEHLDESVTDDIIVSPAQSLTLGGDIAYVGQDFALRRSWSPRELDCTLRPLHCNAPVRWFLFRDVPLPAADRWVTLWLQEDAQVVAPDKAGGHRVRPLRSSQDAVNRKDS